MPGGFCLQGAFIARIEPYLNRKTVFGMVLARCPAHTASRQDFHI